MSDHKNGFLYLLCLDDLNKLPKLQGKYRIPLARGGNSDTEAVPAGMY